MPASMYAVQSQAGAQPHVLTSGPSMADEVSFITGINDAGQVVGTSFWTYNYDSPATYADSSIAGKYGADHATNDEVATVHYFFRHPRTSRRPKRPSISSAWPCGRP